MPASDATDGDTESELTASGGPSGATSSGQSEAGQSEAVADSDNASGPLGGDYGSGTSDTSVRVKVLCKDMSNFQIISSGHTISVSEKVVADASESGISLIWVAFFADTSKVDIG